MCSTISWCVNKSEFSNRFSQLVSMEDNHLDAMSKQILKSRYINLVNSLEVKSKRSAFWFTTLNTFTTVGSIIVPALLSVQDRTFQVNATDQDQDTHENGIYWATWGVSLMVTLSNALLRLFSLDKTYITRKIKSNHLKSEGWLFLELAGEYSRYSTHQEAFVYFCNSIEKIKTEQIIEEYTFESTTSTTPSYTEHNRETTAANTLV
jgi:hypothetical protein